MQRMKLGSMWMPSVGWCLAAVSAVLLWASAAAAAFNLFAAPSVAVEGTPRYLLAGDLTGDGRTDAVVIGADGSTVQVFVADPDSPTRLDPLPALHFGTQLRGGALGHVNGDGRLDLAVADSAAKSVWVLLGKGNGRFNRPYRVAVPDAVAPSAVAIADFHGCGAADLAVADSGADHVSVLRSDHGTPPRFRPGTQVAVGAEPDRIVAADLNGDGRPDFATLNVGGSPAKSVSIGLAQRAADGRLGFDLASHLVGPAPIYLLVADFTADGYPDIATLGQGYEDSIGRILMLVNDGAGAFAADWITEVHCPVFTQGAPCPLRAAAAGDLDGNGSVDLAIAMEDPRTDTWDAVQLFAGRSDGTFVAGPAYATQESPAGIAAGMFVGSGKVDLAVVDTSNPSLQVFVNSQPLGNGRACIADGECLSSRCTDGVCCAADCRPAERCNIPPNQGVCTPVTIDPVPCTLADNSECGEHFCVDGFCCDAPCVGGRCDYPRFEGVCIPATPVDACSEDAECESGFCSDNHVCCREPCIGGFCDDDGICHALLPNGNKCEVDANCQSGVCDAFDAICCNRRCGNYATCFEGVCVAFDSTPSAPSGAAAGTAPPATSTDDMCFADGSSGNDSDSCSIAARPRPRRGALAVMILPAVLWLIHRRGRREAPRRRRGN